MMNTTAIIVAGGQGSRMNHAVPKQFIELDGKPVLIHTIAAFLEADHAMQIILVLPKEHLSEGEHLSKAYFSEKNIRCVVGGETRFHSVKCGLDIITSTDLVLVHDAVRCLITPDLIRRCMHQAAEKGSAIPSIPAKDSIRMMEGEIKNIPLDRAQIRLVQTPQVFQYDLLIKAFQLPYQNNFTDEATVVELAGHPVHLIEGEEENIKITFPSDLLLAKHILQGRG
jgi:2-C-methyl-D-erythritol 4-phosphate cytidylyltransferase